MKNKLLITCLGLLAFLFVRLYTSVPPHVESLKSAPPAPVEIVAPHEPPADFKAAIATDKARSGKWRALRAKLIAAHPFCAYCGGTDHLQAHHIRPFHLHPELELDPNNVIILCESPETDHHLHIGHNGNFKSENPNVVEDCKRNEESLRSLGLWPQR